MIKSKSILTLSILGAVLAGCSGSQGSSGGTTNQPNNVQSGSVMSQLLSIDNSGVVPAFSDAAVSTQTYIHNNSQKAISANIVYQTNLANMVPKGKQSQQTIQISIPAGGVARLPLNIPAMSGKAHQGSILITASYNYQGTAYNLKQVVSFETYSTQNPGIFLSSGAVSSAFGNHIGGYATVFAYGSGKAGSSYTLDSINVPSSLATIVQGKSGTKLASHQVQAIELQTALVQHNQTGAITLNSSASNNHYTSSAKTLAVLGDSGNGSGQGVLIPSLVPNIDIESSESGTAYVYNAGNAAVSGLSVSGGSGISAHCDGACPSTIAAGSGATIDFTLPGGSKSGSGTINIQSSSGTLQVPVNWYDSNSATGQLGISSDALATGVLLSGTPESGSYTVSVSNIGGVPVTNVAAATPVTSGGSATGTIATAGNTCGTTGAPVTLANNGICSYTVNVTDAATPDSGLLTNTVNGKYGTNIVSNHVTVQYTSYSDIANLSISNLGSANLAIAGDNVESASTVMQFTNSSSNVALHNLQLGFNTGNASGINVTGTGNGSTCSNNQDLLPGESCTAIIKLGPQTNSGSTLNGQVYYMVQAAGLPMESSPVVNVSVLSASMNLKLTSIAATGDKDNSESGLLSNPVIFQAGVTGSKKVKFTYTNSSTTGSLTITGIQFANDLNASWVPEYSNIDGTSCFGVSANVPVNKTLAFGASCTVTLDNDLYLSGDSEEVTNLNVVFPTVVIQSGGTMAAFQPGLVAYADSIYHVNNYQAIITDTNTVESNGLAGAYLKLVHAVMGMESGGYTTLLLSSQITPSADLGMPQAAQGCNSNIVSGAWQETCQLSDGTSSEVDYPVIYGAGGVTQADELIFNYQDNLLGTTAFAYLNSGSITGNAQPGNNQASDFIQVNSPITWIVWITKKIYTGVLDGSGGLLACNDTTDSHYPTPYAGQQTYAPILISTVSGSFANSESYVVYNYDANDATKYANVGAIAFTTTPDGSVPFVFTSNVATKTSSGKDYSTTPWSGAIAADTWMNGSYLYQVQGTGTYENTMCSSSAANGAWSDASSSTKGQMVEASKVAVSGMASYTLQDCHYSATIMCATAHP